MLARIASCTAGRLAWRLIERARQGRAKHLPIEIGAGSRIASMSFRMRASLVASLSFALFTSLTLYAVKFTSTWAAPEARSISFAGKKVAAIAMTDDLALRMSTEEALARELTAKKITAMASYRIIPGEELKNPERARAWFQRD